jgi:hypothetical protein
MMRCLLERLEAKTRTGVTLRVLPGGKDPQGQMGVTQGRTVATPPATPASPAQGMAAVIQGATQKAMPKPEAPELFYVDERAGLAVGETVERDGLRLHRFRPSLRVTDLANAGKRGKTCQEFALYDLDYAFQDAKAAAAVSAALKAIAKAPTYAKAVAIAKDAAAPKGKVGVGFQEHTLRGIDVEPAQGAAGAQITLDTATFRLEASATDFSVHEKRRPGPTGDDTQILMPPVGGAKKTAIKAFYAWVQGHQAEVRGMTFRDLRRAMDEADLQYHSFSTMD